jgi:uncharacterized protein YgbK (DUF1537 family)
LLPGGDAPEIVVFSALKAKQWTLLDSFIMRDFNQIVDACERAMTSVDHHDWIQAAANKLMIGSEGLWQSMSAEWVGNCITDADSKAVVEPIRAALMSR